MGFFYWLKSVCNYVITTLNVLYCNNHIILGRYQNTMTEKFENVLFLSNLVDRDGKGRWTHLKIVFNSN